jgi:hypothetical protein
MTQQRQLKARIRERMNRTGESYLTARRHVLNGAPPSSYQLRGGLHPETAAVANCFANRDVINPMSGEPIDESTVLGLGGGLGAGYILWEFDDGDRRVVTTGFRNQWQYPQRWMAKVCDRLNIPAEVVETSGPVRAATQLEEALAGGTPAVVAISAGDIGYWHLPADRSGWMGYPVVVYGRDASDRFLVDDRNVAPLTVDQDTLAAARGRISSYRNRLLVADPAATELDAATFTAAVAAGIDDHISHLSSSSSSFSIPAFKKWTRMVTADAAKGWPVVFADGRGLLGAFVSTVEAVDEVGMLGGNLRAQFARFLGQAGAWLDIDLAPAAVAYTAAAEAWSAVAAVPMQVPAVSAVVEADRRRRDAVARGDSGAGDARVAAERSEELLASDSLDLSIGERDELFAALASALDGAVKAERKALDSLVVAWSAQR